MALGPNKSPNRAAVMEVLNGAPSGHYARDVAAAVDMTPSNCSKLLQNLRQEKLIGSAPDGEKGAPARVRYYALQHRRTALAASEAAKAEKAAKKPAHRRSHAEVIAAERAIVAAEAARRAAQAKQEHEPFFAAMKYGQYVPADTWAAKVYGDSR